MAATYTGREVELNVLRTAFGRAAAGVPSAVVVRGEAGIGKSALVAVAVETVDATVLTATGDENETDLDYGVVEQLLRGTSNEAAVGWTRAPTSDPIEAGAVLLRTLERFDAGRPLVVVVDDAHLADTPSLQALTFAARRLRADPIAVVLTSRLAGFDRIPPGFIRLAERTGGRIDLTGLSVTDISRLATDVYGTSPPERAIRRLREHTGGNPLHARALLGELDYDTLVGPSDLPVPTSFTSLVMSKVASCGDVAQRMVVSLAVLGGPVPADVVATLAGTENALEAVDELVAHDLVRLDAGHGSQTITFSHDLIRTAVYEDIPATRRLAQHASAVALSAGAEAIRHRLAAATGPDDELAADAAALAADEAATGAPQAAAMYLLGAAGVASNAGERQRLLLLAAEHRLSAGQSIEDIADEIVGGEPCARRSFVLGLRMVHRGRLVEAQPEFEDAWDRASTGDERTLAGAVAEQLAVLAVNALNGPDATTWSRRALDSPGVISATLVCHALALGGAADAAIDEMTAILDRHPGALLAADARLGRGIVGLWTNRLELAAEDLAAAGSGADGPLLLYVNVHAYQADLALRLGRSAEAADRAEALTTVLDDSGSVWLAPLAHGVAAFAWARLGDVSRARAHAGLASAAAETSGQAPALIWADHAWLRIADTEQDHESVVTIGDRMVAAGWESIPEGVHHWRATYVDGLTRCGRVVDAARVVDDLERAAALSGDVSIATDTARAAGVLAAAAGDPDRAIRLFDEGLQLDEAEARPFERARLELAAGQVRRRRGRRGEAADLLVRAVERFTVIGARPWAERAERELAGSGLNPMKRSSRPPVSQLTSQERAVARVVAAGRTNREAAAELIVSVKTIEHHLSRIFTKLGVRSRTELAVLLHTSPDV